MTTKATHTEFLEHLIAIEVDAVEVRRHAGLLHFANFPAPWRIEDFDFTAQLSVDPALCALAACRYAHDATNVLCIGTARSWLTLRVPFIGVSRTVHGWQVRPGYAGLSVCHG